MENKATERDMEKRRKEMLSGWNINWRWLMNEQKKEIQILKQDIVGEKINKNSLRE